MKNNIQIKVDNVYSTIHNVPHIVLKRVLNKQGKSVPYTFLDCLSDELSYEVPNLHFVLLSNPNWDGKIRMLITSKSKEKPYDGKFLTGLLGKVIKLIHENLDIVPEVIDLRKIPKPNLSLEWNEKFVIRDYQEEVISSCLKKGRGLINLCTGAGKTLVVSKIIQELGVSPFIFYVLTKDLMYQAKDRIESSIKNLKCGIIGDGICDIKEVNIMTVQTATLAYGMESVKKEFSKIDGWSDGEIKALTSEKLDHLKRKKEIVELIKQAKAIFCDESHHFSAKTCKEIIVKSERCYYFYGGTATPYREDNADIVLLGLFGPKRGNISASFLIKKGYLTRPKIFYTKLKNQPIRALTYEEDYKNNIMFNEERNDIIKNISNRMMEKKLPTLILVQRIEHGDILKEKIKDSVFIHGSTKKEKRAQALEDFSNKKIKVLISSVIADEGLDIPVLECLILAGGGKSKTRIKQRVGRVIRIDSRNPNKKAYVFDFEDNGFYIKKHSRNRKKTLQEEEEFRIQNIDNIYEADNIFSNELF